MVTGMHRIALVAAGGSAVLLAGCGGDDDTTGAPSPSPSPPPWQPTDWACPGILSGTPQSEVDVPTPAVYDAALKDLDMDEVKRDMAVLLKNDVACWPADSNNGKDAPNYAGLMLRLAWHCAGSYREEDAVGGCTGGRQRFFPEGHWPDNTNLDKARALLTPMKQKYGNALSWGDLIILAGTTAMREAGAPISRMCFGRQDEKDGSRAFPLGPTALQEEQHACNFADGSPAPNGQCETLGTTTVGLIYVNPEGPMGNALANESYHEIKRIFARMGHAGDRATVALIGAGHILGKCHGACAPTNTATRSSAGNGPTEAFEQNTDIWRGECGSGTDKGRGEDFTFTSGFDGYWTSTPFNWTNEFFEDLVNENWELTDSAGLHKQYKMLNAPAGKENVIRLVTDIALLEGDYYNISKMYAENFTLLNEEFDRAWDILVTNGVGVWSPQAKCDDDSTVPVTVEPKMRSDDATFAI